MASNFVDFYNNIKSKLFDKNIELGDDSPIRYREHFKLSDLNIISNNINKDSVVMYNDSHISVYNKKDSLLSRTGVLDKSKLIVIDLGNQEAQVKFAIEADLAKINQDMKLVATQVRDECENSQFVILDIQTNFKINQDKLCKVKLWNWIATNKLALLSLGEIGFTVYHWDIDNNHKPRALFHPTEQLESSKCIFNNYEVDSSQKYSYLAYWNNGHKILFHNNRTDISRMIKATTAKFTQYTFAGKEAPSTLFCYAGRNDVVGFLHIVELSDSEPLGELAPRTTSSIHFHAKFDTDTPSLIELATDCGIVFLFTHFGYIHLFDISNGTKLYSTQLFDDSPLNMIRFSNKNGIIGVNTKGAVMSVCVDKKNMLAHIRNELSNEDLANEFKQRFKMDEDVSSCEEKTGFEKTRIVDMNAKELDEYTCGICLNVLNKPMVVQCCRQSYCQHCIEQWLRDNDTCPNDRKPLLRKDLSEAPRVVANVINGMRIRCHVEGCEQVVTIEALDDHIKSYHVGCDKCGEKVVTSDHDCVQYLLGLNKDLNEQNEKLQQLNLSRETSVKSKSKSKSFFKK